VKLREKLALALTDFILVLGAIGLALGLRLDFNWEQMQRYIAPLDNAEPQLFLLISIAAFTVLVFYLFGLYEKVWRYAGTHELVGVVSATLISFLPPQLLILAGEGVVFPRTGLALTALLTITICGGMRLLLRLASEKLGKPITSTRVVIVGANDAGESILRELSRARRPYVVVGFIDDRPDRAGLRIRGVPVRGGLDKLPSLVDSHLVTELVLAEPTPAEVRRVMDAVKGREVQIRVVPALSEMVEGRVKLNRMRELSIEDLLEREPVRVDHAVVRPLIEGRRILITGAGGSIGSEIARQVSSFKPAALMLVGRGENSLYEIGLELPQATLRVCDVCRERSLDRIFAEFRPHVVFHAAAHKHVPLMESAPAEAVYTNVFGTLAVLEACRKYAVERFILLSTDKAVNPNNVMGATKRLAEKLVAHMGHEGFAAVRFGNVLGSRGSVVPTMQKQISRGGPVTVTDAKMTRYFMTIPEAVALVLQASSLATGGEIYLLDMGKPVRILDLAHNLIRLCGYEPGEDIAVEITGCRPGEKLEEELVGRGETTEPTAVAKVQRVLSPGPAADWPGPALENLRAACLNGDNEECRRLLLELVDGASRLRSQDVCSPEGEAKATR
jgi:FlaA1/EpsC-like NDP-sugar epimerase